MELPPDLVERAEKELGETPQTRAAGLKALHDHYAAHPAEKPFRDDDPYLLMFLRHAKFDAARARGRIAAMEKWIAASANDLGDIAKLRGTDFKDLYGQNFAGVLGNDRRTRDGAVINLMLPRNMEPLADPTILLRWNAWVLKRAVHNPHLQVCGQVVLESFEGFRLFHSIRFQQVPQKVMKRNFHFAQECMPFRLRGIWIVHPPKWLSVLMAIAKPFMSAKLRSRVRVFGSDLAALAVEVDPAVLPPEFGGSNPDTGQAWFEEQLRLEAEEDAAAAVAAAGAADAAAPAPAL